MKLLYINADFDENGLETKIYNSIESFVEDRIGIAYNLEQLKELAEEDEPDEKYILDLILSGSCEGEWSTEEVWFIKGDSFRQGLT